ncbi:MAG TPA: beta-propeller domain-containing protein [Burkholderiales bacterium]
MPRLLPLAALLCATLFANTCLAATPVQPAPRKTLTAFSSDAELAAWLAKWHPPARAQPSMSGMANDAAAQSAPGAPPPAPMAMAAPAKEAKSAAKDEQESVTNVQTAGVDEGGIVKVHGDHLVVLRRGRLFTVAVGRGNLEPVAMADAYGAGISPGGTWYDEMLISGDTIVVIGYSYQRGGTEVGVFNIDREGHLSHRNTWHMRSNDYYSSRNYASRLIGNKLVFYTPLAVNAWGDPFANFPAVRRWHDGALPQEFKRIAPATRIYRTDEPLDPNEGIVLHSVTTCDLAKPEMSCSASAVLGPAGRVFYVSASSVYVWTTSYRYDNRGQQAKSGVFRIPLDGEAPTALKAAGSPTDQFSFLESEDGYLNVLVRSNGRGDAMWAAEKQNPGDMALMRVRLSSFGDGTTTAPLSAYKLLPRPADGALQNRFVGPYLIYGSGNSWSRPRDNEARRAYAVRFADGSAAQTVNLGHSVDRIEAMGRNAVVVGTSGSSLYFSSVRLDREASPAYRYVRENAAQGESRSQGFFYKPDGDDSGTVGLPIVNPVGNGRAAHRRLREGSAAVLYLRNDALRLDELGALYARGGQVNDHCQASCVDWYGNARPLFLKNRVFALMGYEIVEGRIEGGAINEIRRVSFAPDTLGMR